MKREKSILVIDDEEIIHLSIVNILSKEGYKTTTVYSAKEGLKKIENEKVDLVITDLMMPEMSGIELMMEMEERDIEVPIIMITGYHLSACCYMSSRRLSTWALKRKEYIPLRQLVQQSPTPWSTSSLVHRFHGRISLQESWPNRTLAPALRGLMLITIQIWILYSATSTR